MSNLCTIYPKNSDLILLYEVVEGEGAVWGGDSASECLNWYKRSGVGSRVVLTTWDSDEEDAHLVGRPIDITDIVKYASKGEGK